jgi:hypothetical protein
METSALPPVIRVSGSKGGGFIAMSGKRGAVTADFIDFGLPSRHARRDRHEFAGKGPKKEPRTK